MKILFLPKYGLAGPSSRYRFYQYFELLEKHNLLYTVKPLFNDNYVTRLFKTGNKNVIELIKSYLRRIMILPSLFAFDLIVVEYEIFPFFPATIERLLYKTGKKYIVDYDDAIFEHYEKNKNWLIRFFLHDKIEKVVKYARYVISGNRYLFDYAHRFNKNVKIIPTVVSKNKYDSIDSFRPVDKFIIGWTGSHTTSRYLLPLCDVFRNFNQDDIQLNLIGFDKSLRYKFEGINVNWIDWNEETEISEIKKFNVGIMPLDESPWAMGKCGFKIIQYMACKLPVIASSIGTNNDLVENGITGFLVSGEKEWINSIICLADNPEIAFGMGKKGYEKFSKNYSFEANANKYVNVIKEVII